MTVVTALLIVSLFCLGIAALIGVELAQRQRGGRGLPVLRRMPTRRVRGRRSLAL